MSNYVVYAIFYSIIILAVGVYFSRKTSANPQNYYLADRSVNRWLGAFSASASSESAWVMMGLAGAAFTSGLSVLWLIPGCMLGYAFNWYVIAPKLSELTTNTQSITLPEAIGKFHSSNLLKYILASVIVIFLMAYVAAQFLAIGKAMHSIADIPQLTGVIIGAFFVVAYIAYGGMKASLVTDFLQAFLMAFVLLVLPVYALTQVGTSTVVPELPEGYMSLTNGSVGFAFVGLILGWAGIGLAYPGQPHILQRFMAMKDEAEISAGGAIAIIWSGLVFTGAILSGVAGKHLVENPLDKELILLDISYLLLPPILGGAVIAAIFAAISSTADSQMLVVSSTLKNDIPFAQRSKKISPKLVTLFVAVLGAFFASTQNKTIFDMVLFAWEFLGVTVGVAVIGTLVIKRGPRSIITSMIVGLVVLFVWRSSPSLSSALYALVPATIGSLLTLYATKFLWRNK